MSEGHTVPGSLVEIIQGWWGFGAFVVGGLIAYSAGRERQRYKIDQIGVEVERQGVRIEALERQGNTEAVQLAEIATSQTHILSSLNEIKEVLRRKADK